ncbi:GNAT family N-acetyltransferase [Brachybacterium sp. GCM10030267]|uniref:GNAT family N-acetyltransferase n=1 Tax=Brachybacterium sp. GCM10030267 TaxID=3273381 RepID=UPI0036160BE3
MTSAITARAATADEYDAVVDLCATAFADEAVTAWALPDPARRDARLRESFRDSLRAALEADAVILALDAADSPIGVSIWVPVPETGPSDEDPEDGEPPAQETATRRLRAVERATAARTPRLPHLHLVSMAVLPEQRGRGAGHALIEAGIARARELGLPLYLEASAPANRALYLRHGFSAHGEPIRLTENGPTLQPMWRN